MASIEFSSTINLGIHGSTRIEDCVVWVGSYHLLKHEPRNSLPNLCRKLGLRPMDLYEVFVPEKAMEPNRIRSWNRLGRMRGIDMYRLWILGRLLQKTLRVHVLDSDYSAQMLGIVSLASADRRRKEK